MKFNSIYNYQKQLPNKDNRTIYGENLNTDGYWDGPISTGEGVEHWSGVRVPSLKRKAAWKRFYRLFPHLRGKKLIHGSSRSRNGLGGYNDINKSTIKLKKVKK